MAISFHCEHCSRKIEAPDNAGGKWGKCPACHKKVYVPDSDIGEELKLAPIDEHDLEKQKELMAETYKLAQDILLEREVPDDSAKPPFEMDDKELTDIIVDYIRQMVNGQLEQAQQLAKLIATCGDRSIAILDKIALSEIPEPGLADIPPQVLAGLLRILSVYKK